MGSIRVIAGKAKSMRLKVPSEQTRPTANRVREALFSRLTPHLPQARVADLFAGSGALGIEALSRGARSCDFVELRLQAARCLEDNLKRSQLTGGRVLRLDTLRFLEGIRHPYELIFADPPWMQTEEDRDFGAELLAHEHLRTQGLASGGWLILEQPDDWTPAEELLKERWEVTDLRFYGKVVLWTLKPMLSGSSLGNS